MSAARICESVLFGILRARARSPCDGGDGASTIRSRISRVRLIVLIDIILNDRLRGSRGQLLARGAESLANTGRFRADPPPLTILDYWKMMVVITEKSPYIRTELDGRTGRGLACRRGQYMDESSGGGPP